MMKCEICGKRAQKAFMYLGAYCSEKHKEKILSDYEAHKKELREEPWDLGPDRLDLESFERFMFKFALHCLDDMPRKQRKFLGKKSPMLLNPEELCLAFKDKVLKHVPTGFFTEERARGHARMFYGGTYKLENPIPKKVLIEAMEKAKLIHSTIDNEEEGEEWKGE